MFIDYNLGGWGRKFGTYGVEIARKREKFLSKEGKSGFVAASRPRQLSAFLYRNVWAMLKRLSCMRKYVVLKIEFIHVYIEFN